jgi:peptidoglycan hydrolase-like protein with peptidoglycan-binding domain
LVVLIGVVPHDSLIVGISPVWSELFHARPAMTVTLLSPHWSANTRVQKAANNSAPIRQGDPDKVAVKLLQQALISTGFPMKAGADGIFGNQTAQAVIAAEKHFGFDADGGVAGREVIGALDLSLRGWKPPPGAHWGGLLARTIIPVAQRKIGRALTALGDVRTMLQVGGFDFVTADGVTMTALRTHFKLVPPGGTRQPIEEFITIATIDPLIANYRGIRNTLNNPRLVRHSICTLGLDVAAEAGLGGPELFGPAYSDFRFDPVEVTNIDITGPNSLAAMMMHEATHVVDAQSGDDATTHISEFTAAYETQQARHARHNPSAYATFAAHIDAGADRPRAQRFGLGAGRPL